MATAAPPASVSPFSKPVSLRLQRKGESIGSIASDGQDTTLNISLITHGAAAVGFLLLALLLLTQWRVRREVTFLL